MQCLVPWRGCLASVRRTAHQLTSSSRAGAKGGADAGAVVAGTCVVSAGCLAGLQARADEAARAAAQEALAARRSAAASATSSAPPGVCAPRLSMKQRIKTQHHGTGRAWGAAPITSSFPLLLGEALGNCLGRL
jgi:hypothetical protein